MVGLAFAKLTRSGDCIAENVKGCKKGYKISKSGNRCDKMKDLFPSKEVLIQENQRLMKELFPDDED